MKQCNRQNANSPSLICGERYTISVRKVELDYNVNCTEDSNSDPPCRNDVTSLLQNTCDGYSFCRIQWSAVECLEYHCMEQPMNSIEVTYNCIESMFSLSKLTFYGFPPAEKIDMCISV